LPPEPSRMLTSPRSLWTLIGALAAVDSVNNAGDHVAARRLFARTPTLSPHEAAALRFDLVRHCFDPASDEPRLRAASRRRM
jgi:hypothetical protein